MCEDQRGPSAATQGPAGPDGEGGPELSFLLGRTPHVGRAFSCAEVSEMALSTQGSSH